jgi:hypothetical protein
MLIGTHNGTQVYYMDKEGKCHILSSDETAHPIHYNATMNSFNLRALDGLFLIRGIIVHIIN